MIIIVILFVQSLLYSFDPTFLMIVILAQTD